jgi:hypothetical protein
MHDQDWDTKAAAEEAQDTASSLAASVKEAARTTTRAAREQASEFASEIGHELSKTAEEQKARGVEAIQGFVRAINSAAGELEKQSPQVASLVRDAAGKVESFSGSIGNRYVNDLIKAASELARSHPLLFFGGAVAAGFALSRFLKSTAKDNGEMQMAASSGSGSSQMGGSQVGSSQMGSSTMGSSMGSPGSGRSSQMGSSMGSSSQMGSGRSSSASSGSYGSGSSGSSRSGDFDR